MSQGSFKPPNPTFESIYSNRDMCFKMSGNSKSFDHLTTNSNSSSFAPIRVQPKENVYAEIGSIKPPNGSEPNKNNSNINIKTSSHEKGNGSDSISKPSPLSKIKNVLKVFRIKSLPKHSSSSSNNSTNANSNESRGNTVSISSTNSKVPNGSLINPLNGNDLH